MKKARWNKKGVAVSTFIIGLFIIGGAAQLMISFAQDVNDPLKYNKNLTVGKIEKYNTIFNATSFSSQIRDKSVSSELDFDLSFNSLPALVWDSLRSIADSAVSAPNLILNLAVSAANDLSLPDWVVQVVVGIFTISFVISIIAGVLRSGF